MRIDFRLELLFWWLAIVRRYSHKEGYPDGLLLIIAFFRFSWSGKCKGYSGLFKICNLVFVVSTKKCKLFYGQRKYLSAVIYADIKAGKKN